MRLRNRITKRLSLFAARGIAGQFSTNGPRYRIQENLNARTVTVRLDLLGFCTLPTVSNFASRMLFFFYGGNTNKRL